MSRRRRRAAGAADNLALQPRLRAPRRQSRGRRRTILRPASSTSQRLQSRRSLAARADQDERRACRRRSSASAADGKQALAVDRRRATGWPSATNRIEGLKVDLKVGDLWGARDISGLAQLARAEVAGESIADIRLTADGRRRYKRSRFPRNRSRPRGEGAGAACRRLRRSGLISRVSPREGAGRTIALASPATLTYGKDGLAIQNFALARRFRPPLALRPRGLEPRSSRFRNRLAAGGARPRLARASACPELPTAMRRSAAARARRPATGGFASARSARRRRATLARRPSTSRARAVWRAAEPRWT